MPSFLHRANTLATISATIVAIMCGIVSLSNNFHIDNPVADIKVNLTLNISANLESPFIWNTKPVFVFAAAETTTPQNGFKRRDPTEIVERVEYLVPMVLAILLTPVSISLVTADHLLVDTPDTIDHCSVDSLEPIVVVLWMTLVFILLATILNNVVRARYPIPSKKPPFRVKSCAYGAWISVTIARLLSMILVFMVLEVKLQKFVCFSTSMRALFIVTSSLLILGFLFDSYVWLVEATPDAALPGASDAAPLAATPDDAFPVALDITSSAAPVTALYTKGKKNNPENELPVNNDDEVLPQHSPSKHNHNQVSECASSPDLQSGRMSSNGSSLEPNAMLILKREAPSTSKPTYSTPVIPAKVKKQGDSFVDDQRLADARRRLAANYHEAKNG